MIDFSSNDFTAAVWFFILHGKLSSIFVRLCVYRYQKFFASNLLIFIRWLCEMLVSINQHEVKKNPRKTSFLNLVLFFVLSIKYEIGLTTLLNRIVPHESESCNHKHWTISFQFVLCCLAKSNECELRMWIGRINLIF